MKRRLVIATAAVGVLFGSFVWGARTGAYIQQIGMAQYRAVITYGRIRELETNPKGLKEMLENDIDSELIAHNEYRESHLKWLVPALETPDDRYGKKAAYYRLDHPHELDTSVLAPYGQVYGQQALDFLMEGAHSRREELDEVLGYYSSQRTAVDAFPEQCPATATQGRR